MSSFIYTEKKKKKKIKIRMSSAEIVIAALRVKIKALYCQIWIMDFIMSFFLHYSSLLSWN